MKAIFHASAPNTTALKVNANSTTPSPRKSNLSILAPVAHAPIPTAKSDLDLAAILITQTTQRLAVCHGQKNGDSLTGYEDQAVRTPVMLESQPLKTTTLTPRLTTFPKQTR